MKYLSQFIIGVLFGIILVRAEIVSWFRIQEMFRFQSFHMYGIIGSAILVGFISVYLIRRFKIRSVSGEKIDLSPKPLQKTANISGGFLFGLGWALTGACPGPIYTLIGSGILVFIAVLISAWLGTFVYGLLRKKLPH